MENSGKVEIHIWGESGDEISRLSGLNLCHNEIGRIFRLGTEKNTDLIIITHEKVPDDVIRYY